LRYNCKYTPGELVVIENSIPRSLETVLEKAVKEFPVVILIGSRQSGKTTLQPEFENDVL